MYRYRMREYLRGRQASRIADVAASLTAAAGGSAGPAASGPVSDHSAAPPPRRGRRHHLVPHQGLGAGDDNVPSGNGAGWDR